MDLDALLDAPVSTAAKYAQNVRQVAGSVTIVTAEDIQRFGYRTLTDVLQSMAGVYVSNQRGESLALNLQGVERIELVRGPSSGLYGTGAMFAVINIISKNDHDLGGVQVDAEAGSLGRRSVGVVAGSSLGHRGSVSVSAMLEDTDGNPSLYFPAYDDPATNNGIANNKDWIRRNNIQVAGNLGGFTLRASHSYRLRSDPTGSYGTLFNAPNQLMDQFRFVELANVAELSPTRRLSTRVYYDDIRYAGKYPGVGFYFHQNAANRVLGAEASLRWDLGSRHRLTIGAEYRRYLESKLSSPDDTSFVIGRPFTVGSLYLQDEFQLLPTLTLLAGVRHDENEIGGGATTPRAAILYDPWKGSTFKLMYGRAYRAPAFYESAFKSAGISGELGPEKLEMYEAIWLQSLGKRYALSSSLYHYKVHHLIDAIHLFEYVNLTTVEAEGVEITLDARPTSGTRAYLNYTLQHAHQAGAALTNSPTHMLKAGLGRDLFRAATAAVELRYESSRTTPQSTTTDGFFLANSNLTLRSFATRSRDSALLTGLELGFRIENVFNTRYANPGSIEHLQSSIEQNGRTFVVRLTSRF